MNQPSTFVLFSLYQCASLFLCSTDCSHGDFEGHEKRLKVIRKVSKQLGIPVAVCGDLQGPKLRVGKIPEGVGKSAKSGGGTVVVSAGVRAAPVVSAAAPVAHGRAQLSPVYDACGCAWCAMSK